ncbi:MAG: CHASE domain-containing protein [Candidatus Uhrbacteria bacterium]|nr:CHASE domain-containing protein [Candidatus Uhrbacteria bacterium]
MKGRKKIIGRLKYVVIPGMLIIVVVATINFLIYRREFDFFHNIYDNEVAGTMSLINRRFQSALIAAESTRAFFISSQDVTRDEFDLFASVLTKNIGSGGLFVPLTVEWVDAQNKIQYVHPMNEDNAKIVGFDLNQYANRLAPILKAKATRLPVVTEPIMLAQGFPGLLIYSPIFKGDEYLGEVVVVLRLSDLLAPIQGTNPFYYNGTYIQTGSFIIPFDDDVILNNNGERIISPQGEMVKDPLSLEYPAGKMGLEGADLFFADKVWQVKFLPAYIEQTNNRALVYGGLLVLFVSTIIIFLLILQKRRERLLTEMAKNEAMILGIGEGLVACDKKGVVTFANTIAEELSGYSIKEVMGKSYLDVWRLVDSKGVDVPKEERPFFSALHKKEVTKISTESHLYIIRKDGTRFPLASTIAPLLVEGEVNGVIAVFTDITKESEVDRMKTEFLSLASHQLLTPASVVKWTTELLLDGSGGGIGQETKGTY